MLALAAPAIPILGKRKGVQRRSGTTIATMARRLVSRLAAELQFYNRLEKEEKEEEERKL
jgi:hypothetical protein